ncbi:MAG: helix-turn-helix transcriptional regulator [Lachnospiraceae bacterium]|nr:helix-turn-helix transcriptional regulator [Lachnospiraceae bacterium]MCR5634720.1 helix-turn-helix domain-containing protein [Lachnospiraceae bacterium]
MKNKGTMSFLYKNGTEKVDISQLQKNTQQSVVTQYKSIRKGKRLTQVELSKLTGIPQPNITRFESDKSNPTLEMLVKMAAALGKKVTITLEDIEEPSDTTN